MAVRATPAVALACACFVALTLIELAVPLALGRAVAVAVMGREFVPWERAVTATIILTISKSNTIPIMAPKSAGFVRRLRRCAGSRG